MPDRFTLTIRHYPLAEELRPFFTALYSTTIRIEGGVRICDRLHPEWAALRFWESGEQQLAGVFPAMPASVAKFAVSGPTSNAIQVDLKSGRFWTLGLRPLGWAKFISAPANQWADMITDATAIAALRPFAPLLEIIEQADADDNDKVQAINGHLCGLARRKLRNEDKILACHKALRDPEVSDVSALANRSGVERRTLERLCTRYFGFTPKRLLRRQRFLRSLARFTLQHNEKWTNVLDGQYVDQSHFVRDFRAFMGTTPTEYAEAPHPVIDRLLKQRRPDLEGIPETSLPTVLRYSRGND